MKKKVWIAITDDGVPYEIFWNEGEKENAEKNSAIYKIQQIHFGAKIIPAILNYQFKKSR